jgi:hypothetical protein
MITVLPVHVVGEHDRPSPEMTATCRPSGDQFGEPEVKAGNNGRAVPSLPRM